MEQRRNPDLFTPEEAAEYLHLPSVESLRTLRDKGVLAGFKGWAPYLIYHREDLDAAALKMTGRNPATGEKARPVAAAKRMQMAE